MAAEQTTKQITTSQTVAMEDDEIIERYKVLTNELETKAEVLVAILNEKDYQMQKLRLQYEDILTTLEEKENRIVDLEFELVAASEDGKDVDQSLLEKSDRDSEKSSSFYRQEIEEKDKEIGKLTVDLKNCTRYLQEILNKELWSKNKEIEKLHCKQVNSSPEITRLKKNLSDKEHQLNVLKEKISELGLEINIPHDGCMGSPNIVSTPINSELITKLEQQLEHCKAERSYFQEKCKEFETSNFEDVIEELWTKNAALEEEIKKSEQLREKSNEVCGHLNTRLEELAVFLDSLLKQKSILGYLGTYKERKLREIINNSLDLSKSFAMSMIINPDQSLTQLSNITSLLNGSTFQELTLDVLQEEDEEAVDEEKAILSIVPSNITLRYKSHLCRVDDTKSNSEQVIDALREQIFNLQSELKLRDIELNKFSLKETTDVTTETDSLLHINITSQTLKEASKLYVPIIQADCQSESEAWSEPDINVSRQRIGLSRTLPVGGDLGHESTENDSLHSTTPTRRTFEKRASFTELHHQIAQLQEELKNKTDSLRQAEENVVKLGDLEAELDLTRGELKNASERVVDLENELAQLKITVEQLDKTKQKLEEEMVVKDKEMQNRINSLEAEKMKASELAEKCEKEAVQAKEAVKQMEERIEKVLKESDEIKEQLKREYEEVAVVKIKHIEDQFRTKLREIETKTAADFESFKSEYDRDFIRKSEVDEKLNELVKLQKEIAAFKSVVRSYEETIDDYVRQDRQVENKTLEYQEKLHAMRKDLDHITLQYSQAVLEKTKLTNEKTILEQDLDRFRLGAGQLKRRVEDIQVDFEKTNDDSHKHIKELQKCKSELEMKITELESSNAELHNKLVRLQANRCDFNQSMPDLATTTVRTIQIMPFKRQISAQTCTSDEVLDDCLDPASVAAHTNLQAAGDIERQEVNSSPDLGIESDQGRFSSLEMQNLPRPLRQTLELTQSMSNLLDADENDRLESVTCDKDSEHCCQKTLAIKHENNDLKRKVHKLQKALQETINQLNLANQRKKLVEKTICKQIHKTSQVLKQAKANLDSGSDNDLYKS